MLGNTYLVKPDTPTVILTVIHPNYDFKSATSASDIAMLKLSTTVAITSLINVVGSLETNMNYNYANKPFYVCGYGYIDNKKTKPVYMTCGTLYYAIPTECLLGTVNTELCFTSAANSGGPCGRDNGAPLYRVNADGTRILVGIFVRIVGSSSKSMCIDGNAKYVFTNVAAFDSFITTTISLNINI